MGLREMTEKHQPIARLLKPGYLLRDENGEILDARSSVTLIIAGTHKIVVDTGLVGEDEFIRNRLDQFQITPEDVDVVVNTHSHPDHCGNNHLFKKARIFAKDDSDLKESKAIAPGVWIMETPGHSLDSISVVCESAYRVIMAGDAIPIIGNYLKWVPPRLHVDRKKAMESMSRIVELAEIVVPGHDKPFLVSENIYIDL